ncbi:MAG: M23 family metallopeptidase [Vicingaceae bacterium]
MVTHEEPGSHEAFKFLKVEVTNVDTTKQCAKSTWIRYTDDPENDFVFKRSNNGNDKIEKNKPLFLKVKKGDQVHNYYVIKWENAAKKFQRPTRVRQPYISSPYGTRRIQGRNQFHGAMDIVSDENISGSKLFPLGLGFVEIAHSYSTRNHWNDYASGRMTVNDPRSVGIMVRINYGNNRKSRYIHLSSLEISSKTWVKPDVPVGKVGNTGISTDPHLHFNFYENNTSSRNPNDFLTHPYRQGDYYIIKTNLLSGDPDKIKWKECKRDEWRAPEPLLTKGAVYYNKKILWKKIIVYNPISLSGHGNVLRTENEYRKKDYVSIPFHYYISKEGLVYSGMPLEIMSSIKGLSKTNPKDCEKWQSILVGYEGPTMSLNNTDIRYVSLQTLTKKLKQNYSISNNLIFRTE